MKRDLKIYNEAKGWTLHATDLPRAEILNDFAQAAQAHVILGVPLVQDDPVLVRVTTGKLSPKEEAEWVARATRRLKLPDGSLTLEGGFDEAGDPSMRQTLEVPPGDYRVDVYTLFWGINGEYCLPEGEPLGSWFRRTHAGKRFPALHQLTLAEEPELDPGFEAKWEKLADSDRYDDLEAPDQVDFIVQLTSWREGTELTPLKEDGWLPIDANARRPEKCPLGLAFS